MESVLSAHNLRAGYQERTVLRNISMKISVGEKLLLLGPNGCGKSTLLKVLAGALEAWQGQIQFKGNDVTHVLGHRRIQSGIGYLMQTRNTFPNLSVEENLRLSFWDTKGDYPRRRDWLLNIFPILKDNLSNRAGFLSGGERQALAISMVLMRSVEVLLLDEPTAGLSPKAATAILQALHEINIKAEIPLIIVEHQLKLVHKWVSRAIIMNQGKIVAEEYDPKMLLNHERLQMFYFQ